MGLPSRAALLAVSEWEVSAACMHMYAHAGGHGRGAGSERAGGSTRQHSRSPQEAAPVARCALRCRPHTRKGREGRKELRVPRTPRTASRAHAATAHRRCVGPPAQHPFSACEAYTGAKSASSTRCLPGRAPCHRLRQRLRVHGFASPAVWHLLQTGSGAVPTCLSRCTNSSTGAACRAAVPARHCFTWMPSFCCAGKGCRRVCGAAGGVEGSILTDPHVYADMYSCMPVDALQRHTCKRHSATEELAKPNRRELAMMMCALLLLCTRASAPVACVAGPTGYWLGLPHQ